MIDDEHTTEQTDDTAPAEDSLEDLDVTTESGADVKGGVPVLRGDGSGDGRQQR